MTRVVLRNGQIAFVVGFVEIRPFCLQGKTDSGRLELWQECGAWREDATAHPLDIVGVVTAQGHIERLNIKPSP